MILFVFYGDNMIFIKKSEIALQLNSLNWPSHTSFMD